MSVFYCRTWIWFDWLIQCIREIQCIVYIYIYICSTYTHVHTLCSCLIYLTYHALWDYSDETHQQLDFLMLWHLNRSFSVCTGRNLTGRSAWNNWGRPMHGCSWSAKLGKVVLAQGPSSQGGVTLGSFWNIENDDTKHDHGSSSILVWCFDFEIRLWIHVGSHVLSVLWAKQWSLADFCFCFPMSLLCVFLVAQIFPTQAASHSQQLAEGRPPFKQKHFVEATRLQLDQIASIAGKTHYVISIYFLAQLAGLGINRLHFGAVHHCITWYCQAQCMPAAAFRKQIWWKELGHKFAMVALAWSYMHLLLTSFVKPCRVCNHTKSRCKDDADWYRFRVV